MLIIVSKALDRSFSNSNAFSRRRFFSRLPFSVFNMKTNWRKRRLLRITDNHDSKFSKISCMQFGILDL